RSEELRQKVKALIPVFKNLRELGMSLMPEEYTSSARTRILFYFQKFPMSIIDGDEILVISGIQEYARRIRELRVQFGWSIASGITMKEMRKENESDIPDGMAEMKPDQYVLLSLAQDRDAAHRWNSANSIQKESISVRDKILKYFRANVGKPITGEELRYVAGNKTEWARRTRELRTEYGWPVASKATGQPDLPIGTYILQADRQSPEHDRKIPDDVRREVLRKDGYSCRSCKWSYTEWNPSDPRNLELHHIKHHVQGGDNREENLATLCSVCHDKEHRRKN
ncbi:MAG: HNH endonuclease signature motif containing protein, partial [Syntrophales bacterium]|nr:HNH endonuclease signature motif containing protein [Syntrophales bacterium]